MASRFDAFYWNNPMYYAEITNTADAIRTITFLKSERVGFSLYLNGNTVHFNSKEHRDLYTSGLETFMSLGLPFDVL